MKRILLAGVGLLAAALVSGAANAQDTIKIGVIAAFSGQFADTAAQIDNGIKLYMKQQGDKVAGKKIEIIRKDTGGPNPDVAKRLAQELVVRDKVDILAGFALTPKALGAADVATEAKKLMVDMNAATSVVTEKSPYIVRTSLTMPQIDRDRRQVGRDQGRRQEGLHDGVRLRARASMPRPRSSKGFKEAGGEIIGSVRMPVANPDFSAFVQRAKDLNPEGDLHVRPRRRAAGGNRQGVGRTRHRPQEDQDHRRSGELDRRAGAREHGRHRARHRSPPGTTTRSRDQDEQGLRRRPTTPSSSAIPTSSRSAAMTACTSSTRR